MAHIGHRCGCGHSNLLHTTSEAGRASCHADCGRSCGRGCRKSTKSILLPTFDRKGRQIERIVRPGEGLATETGTATPRTCECESCQALYAELTSA